MNAGGLSEPIRVIQTGCRGLNVVETSEELIFMGFMMSVTNPNSRILTYTHDYEHVNEIILDICGAMFTELSLCLDNAFIFGTHSEGKISVINVETNEVHIDDTPPFGGVENIWGACVFYPRPEGEPQTIFVFTTNGLYQCVLTPQGHFMYCMEAFYEG